MIDEKIVFGKTPDTVNLEKRIKLSMIDEEENKFLAMVGIINILAIALTFLL